MELHTLNSQSGELIASYKIDQACLEVRQLEHYRWFHFGDNAIQSIINTKVPQQVCMPICQSMLLFLLWKKQPLSILNLGMGGGTFERFFSGIPQVNLTSVEQSAAVIKMAKKYFFLSEQQVHCQSAEQYLQQTTQQFNVILCDIFSHNKNEACIDQPSFYQNLAERIHNNGVVLMNIDPENEQNLVKLLLIISKYFSHIALIEFKNYKNLVLALSKLQLPNKEELLNLNKAGDNSANIDFSKAVSNMQFLPYKSQ